MTVCLEAVEIYFKSVISREAGRTSPCSRTTANGLLAQDGLLHSAQASQERPGVGGDEHPYMHTMLNLQMI